MEITKRYSLNSRLTINEVAEILGSEKKRSSVNKLVKKLVDNQEKFGKITMFNSESNEIIKNGKSYLLSLNTVDYIINQLSDRNSEEIKRVDTINNIVEYRILKDYYEELKEMILKKENYIENEEEIFDKIDMMKISNKKEIQRYIELLNNKDDEVSDAFHIVNDKLETIVNDNKITELLFMQQEEHAKLLDEQLKDMKRQRDYFKNEYRKLKEEIKK